MSQSHRWGFGDSVSRIARLLKVFRELLPYLDNLFCPVLEPVGHVGEMNPEQKKELRRSAGDCQHREDLDFRDTSGLRVEKIAE